MTCKKCGKSLDGLDVGAYRKLVDKSANVFECRLCLAKELNWTDDYMESVIRIHRERGCTLFPPLKNEKED